MYAVVLSSGRLSGVQGMNFCTGSGVAALV